MHPASLSIQPARAFWCVDMGTAANIHYHFINDKMQRGSSEQVEILQLELCSLEIEMAKHGSEYSPKNGEAAPVSTRVTAWK